MLDLSTVRKVWVWTTNPIKVAAVQDVFTRLWLWHIEVAWFNSTSHVSEMPLSTEETKKWSYNRALQLMERGIFDMAFWLEWGVEFTTLPNGKNSCMLFWRTTIIDATWYVSSWSSWMLPIPWEVAFALQWWAELGPYISEKTWIDNMKQKWWTIWFLSRWVISRQEAFETASTQAVIPWLHKDLYEE